MSRRKGSELGRAQFSVAFEMEASWHLVGDQLRRAAMVLLEQMREYESEAGEILERKQLPPPDDPDFEIVQRSLMEPQVIMLLGFSLENHFKGLWVLQNPDKAKGVDEFPKEFNRAGGGGHDLTKWAEAAKIELDEKEKGLLRLLTQVTLWRGRYPMAKNADRNAEAWAVPGRLSDALSNSSGEPDWSPEVYSVLKKIEAKSLEITG